MKRDVPQPIQLTEDEAPVPASEQNSDSRPIEVSPEVVEQWLIAGQTVLVDVREDFEHAEEHIAGAHPAPLSRFDAEAIRIRLSGSRVVFHCRSGKRSAQAAEKFRASGEHVYHLAGGIEAWIQAGKPTVKSECAPRLPVMRQVQIAAGFLVMLGVVLGLTISPWFLTLSAFVGCGLMFAGATGWCGMALILARMPWNRSLIHTSRRNP